MNKINKNFLKDSFYISDLKLCSIRLINNCKFPWLILIPNRRNVRDITELNLKDQTLLMKEIVFSIKIMKKIFRTSKLNVEKIGNIVPQLHIHVIARSIKDGAWPLPVWAVKGKPYSKKKSEQLIDKLKNVFKNFKG